MDAESQSFVSTARALYDIDGISTFTDSQILKFREAKKGHNGRSLEAIAKTLTWRRESLIDEILDEDFLQLESSGKLQVFGAALDGSIVFIWQGSRHTAPKSPIDNEKELRYIIYMLEKAVRSGALVDKLTIIFDRTGMRLDTQDFKLASYIVPVLQSHYPERLSKMFIFPTNNMIRLLWNGSANMMMDTATIPKIHLAETSFSIGAHIESSNYFSKYGGTGGDPYDKKTEAQLALNAVIKKTASLDRSRVDVELIWERPEVHSYID